MQVLRTLWLALFGSTFVYLGVLVYVGRTGDAGDGLAPLWLALTAAALSTAVASVLLPGFLYRAALRGARWDTVEAGGGAPTARGPHGARVFSDPGAALAQATRRYLPPFLVGCALAEAVAIFGLVLGFLGAGLGTVLPFFGVSWALFVLRFPRRAHVVRPLEALTDARLDPAPDGPRPVGG